MIKKLQFIIKQIAHTKDKEVFKMNKNQRIKCNVASCKFNNETAKMCELEEILVSYCPDCDNGEAKDESMCDSYECKH